MTAHVMSLVQLVVLFINISCVCKASARLLKLPVPVPAIFKKSGTNRQ